MKAKISELWDTGIEIIIPNSDENEIQSISDLRKYDNVLIGDRLKDTPVTEIIIDDEFLYVSFRNVTHPTGFGELKICQIN